MSKGVEKYEFDFSEGIETRLSELSKRVHIIDMQNMWLPNDEIGAIERIPGSASLLDFSSLGMTDRIVSINHGYNEMTGRLGLVVCSEIGETYFAYWDQDGNSDSGNLNDGLSGPGTPIGSCGHPAIVRIGIREGANPTYCLNFNAEAPAAHVHFGDVLDFAHTDSFTVEVLYRGWAQGVQMLFGKRGGLGAASKGYSLNITGDGKVHASVCDGTTEYTAESTTVVAETGNALPRWYRISLVYAPYSVRIHIDGELEDSASAAGTGSFDGTLTANLRAGKTSGGTNPLTGDLADLRIWDIARDTDDIERDAFSYLYGNESNLQGYWRLNEYAGTTVEDLSTGENDGTISDATWALANQSGNEFPGTHRPYFFFFYGKSDLEPRSASGLPPTKSIVGSSVNSTVGLTLPDVSDNSNDTGIYIAAAEVSDEENNVKGIVKYFIAEINGDEEGPYSDPLRISSGGPTLNLNKDDFVDCENGMQVTLTVAASWAGKGKEYKVYRTLAYGTLPFEVGRIDSSGVFSSLVGGGLKDNVKDTEVGDLPYVHGDVVPYSARPAVVFVGRIFVADGTRIYWTDVVNPQSWWTDQNEGNWVDVAPEDGDYITALAADRDGLIIWKSSHIYKLYGRDPYEFNLRPLAPTSSVPVSVGTPNIGAICEYPGGIAFYWNSGVYLYSSTSGIRKISDPLESLIDNEPMDEYTEVQLGYHSAPGINQIWYSVDEDPAVGVPKTWIYDLDTQRWVGQRYEHAFSMQTVRPVFGLGGSSAFVDGEFVGGIDAELTRLWVPGASLAGLSQGSSYVDLSPFYGGNPDTLKTFLYLEVFFEPKSVGSFTVRHYVNGEDANAVTQTVTQVISGTPERQKVRVPIKEKGRSLDIRLANLSGHPDLQFKVFKLVYGYIEHEAVHDD